MKESSNNAQVQLKRVSSAYWRVVMNNPPLNLMGPEFVLQLREIMTAIETDPQLRGNLGQSVDVALDPVLL